MRKFLAFSILSLAACVQEETATGPGGIVISNTQSGSRIKLRQTTQTVTTPDGARYEVRSILPGLFDSKLGLSCSVLGAEDGKPRCLPGGAGLTGYYLDAGCSQPLAMMNPCSVKEAPQYVLSGSPAKPGMCSQTGYQYKVFRIGTEIQRPRSLHGGNPAACTMLDGAILDTVYAGHRFFDVGAEVPASDFAEVQSQTQTSELM